MQCLPVRNLFFVLQKLALTTLLIRKQKDENPTQFPTDRNFTYCDSTSNWSLRGHVEKFHLDLYLEEAERNGWSIYLENVKEAFRVGYTYLTLRQALCRPNTTIRKLPPLSQLPTANSSSEALQSSAPPPFSLAALHQFLVKFIVSDDQASLRGTHSLSSLTVWTVDQRCRVSGVPAATPFPSPGTERQPNTSQNEDARDNY